MTPKICLLTDHHLCINPRTWKEAFFYEKKGFEVIVLTMWQSKDLLERDYELLKGHNISYKAYLNLIPGEVNELKRFWYRLRSRLAAELQRFFKVGTKWAISHAPELMLKKALAEDATMYAAHLESAFYVGRDLLKKGKKVCFDFEDWYSHDYLVPQRAVQLLNKVEKYALINGLYSTATSKNMAVALNANHNLDKEITVIYNGFPDSIINANKPTSRIIPAGDDRVRVLWFSRNIGPDRGIEFLLKALSACKIPIELNLLGMINNGYKEFLNNNFPQASIHRMVLHSFLPHLQLENFISQFDIGLAIEETLNDNRNVTITNKILQYIQAGLPVLASNTKGQNEVAEFFPKTVQVVDLNNTLEWEQAVSYLSKISVQEREDQKAKYEEIFSWSAQEKKLDNLITRYL